MKFIVQYTCYVNESELPYPAQHTTMRLYTGHTFNFTDSKQCAITCTVSACLEGASCQWSVVSDPYTFTGCMVNT